MHCNICGDDRTAHYRPNQRQVLCDHCAENTPAKVSRSEFDKAYWNEPEAEQPPESTKREFYSDYLTSCNTLREYITATTAEI